MCGEAGHTHSSLWTTEGRPHTVVCRRMSPRCLGPSPHLSGGGVPGSPRASSPESQASLGSLPAKGPSSWGACSSPAPPHGGGQGNMSRLGGGQGRAAPLCPAPAPPPGLPPRPPHPASASHALDARRCPRLSARPEPRPTSPGLAWTPAPSAFPEGPRGARSRGRPLAAGVAGLPPSRPPAQPSGGNCGPSTWRWRHPLPLGASLSFADTHTPEGRPRGLPASLYCT